MLELTDLKPGDTLGRYEILMPVAHGGMAAVWAARMVGSRGFQKIVAVKTMLPTISDDPDFETMFLDEARLASRIHHPHVVEIVDLGDEHGWLYIVMEWVDGETIFTLNKRAKAKGGIPLPLLLRIMSSSCAGLHAAHELRDEKSGKLLDLVHRDISPQNIMISTTGIVKIVDFGVAKAAGRLHNTVIKGLMKGKVHYGSPEQISGEKLDRRSDIFSLGMLMYLMLSGLHPFRGDTDTKTMENICKRAPVPLRELVPGLRADVEAVVMRALEKDPERRWPDCAAMQRALDQALSGLGTAVTDGDVASFMKSVLGDVSAERRAKLATAIEQADNVAPAPPTDTPASRRAGRGGPTGLPATFKGIIPVSLDDEAHPPRSAPRSTSTPRPNAGPPKSIPPKSIPPKSMGGPKTVPPTVGGPLRPSASQAASATPEDAQPVLFASTRAQGSSSRAPYVVLGALALLGGAAFGVRSGSLPWLADALPEPLRAMLAPPAGTTAPSRSASTAPSAATTASAAASAQLSAATDAPDAAVTDAAIADAADSDAAIADAAVPDASISDAAPDAIAPAATSTAWPAAPGGPLKQKQPDSPYE